VISERQQEILRLRSIVNAMFPDPLDTVYAMLRGLSGDDVFFRRKDREPVASLLTAEFKGAALMMYRFVGTATDFDPNPDASKIVQQVLMGALLHFLRTVCGYDDAAIQELRGSVPNFALKFSMFDGLGETQ